VQDLGLAGTYAVNDEVRLFCGMLDRLAFLPVADVPAGMQVLRGAIPAVDGMNDLVDYFDVTYVTGTARRIKRPQTSSTALTSNGRRWRESAGDSFVPHPCSTVSTAEVECT